MNNKSTALTAFGAASAIMYISPSAEATVIDLTNNIVPDSVPGQATSVSVTVDVGSGLFSFLQWNDPIGKTLFSANGSIGLVSGSGMVSAGLFGGDTAVNPGTGLQFIGFVTNGGLSGWLQVDFGGVGDTIQYLAGAYDDSGAAIMVGDTGGNVSVPEPTTLGLTALGLLAAGAAGKRRKANLAAA